MNSSAKDFILKIKDPILKRHYRLAFSCKVSKNDIITDRVNIIFKNITIDNVIYLLSILDTKIIDDWVKEKFSFGKIIFFSFTGHAIKVYIEDPNVEYIIESIEYLDDKISYRNYKLFKSNKNDYINHIPKELEKYINYNVSEIRTDGQIYFKHKKTNNTIPIMNEEIKYSFILMFLKMRGLLKEDTRDLDVFTSWLSVMKDKYFNWLQISDDSFTIYMS